MDYITNNCINDEFIEFINYNKKLNFKYCKDNEFNKKINELCKRLNKKLKIYLSYTNISDVLNLGSVHTLDLTCTNISDVSNLGSVHILDLSYCENIVDVSCLGSVHTLYLEGCNNIVDVSCLGSVHKLNLSYCEI